MSDSTAAANGAVAESGQTHHEHPPYQRHHFETVDQQFDATNFAMWLFLLTEIMFFGGLFTAYLIMRNWYYPAFVEGSHQLNVGWGTANTAVLILSSFTMAMGVWSAEMRKRGMLILFLCLTWILGIGFLGIKSIEYHEKWEIAVGLLLPGAHLPAQPRARIAQCLLRVHAIFTGVGRDARRVDRHTAQLHHPLLLRPLQNLRERVVQGPACRRRNALSAQLSTRSPAAR